MADKSRRATSVSNLSGGEGDSLPDDEREIPEKPDDVVQRWTSEIERAETYFRAWYARGDKIIKRYRDERPETLHGRGQGRRFNILWSNVQTLAPALYQTRPKAQVSRRHLDKDAIGRVAAQMLERAVAYSVDVYDFDGLIKRVREDYLLCGRGTAWQRYAPVFDGAAKASQTDHLLHEDEMLSGETAPCDYVNWKDFLHCPAPTWERVPWVARRVFMGRKQLDKRFGVEIAKHIPRLHSPHQRDGNGSHRDQGQGFTQALVWEIWDKTSARAYWICPDYKDGPLDVVDDPLGLSGFFPCPKPLYATMTNDTTVPVPDYILYQDQAQEIDVLTERIDLLLKALAVRGVYDASNEHIALLVDDTPENRLVPVSNWAAFAEKGGLRGQVSFLPVDQIQNVVQGLYQARQVLKADLDEITGISDIIRGRGMPTETATAQRIKGNFASLRLEDRRKDVAHFCAELMRLKAEIIAEHFSDATLREISGFDAMVEIITARRPTAEEEHLLAQAKQNAEKWMQAQSLVQAQQAGQLPGQVVLQAAETTEPPPDPRIVAEQIAKAGKARADTLFAQAVKLLRNDKMRTLRLDIDVDTMIEPDRMAEQHRRTEFLTAVSRFVSQTVDAAARVPEIAPLMGEILLFGVRGYRAGRQVEGAFEDALERLKTTSELRSQTPVQEQTPDPRLQYLQNELAIKARKAQGEAALDAAELQVETVLKEKEIANELRVKREEMLMKNGISPSRYAEIFSD